MKYYDCSTDQTIDVSIWFWIYYFTKKFKASIPRYFWYALALPAGEVCKRCVNNLSYEIYAWQRNRDHKKFMKEYNKRKELQ